MKSSFLKIGLRLFVFQLGLFLCQSILAVNFTVTPTAISNTYSGPITLQVTGLTSGDTVVVQKFLDANANGVVDATDILFQQFQLTDGTASVFYDGATAVTNFNVPGDMDGSANGQITAQLYPGLDFAQVIVGKYLFVLSSPGGHFPPQTISFSVTNFPFAQTISGNVVSNTTPVPNAVVILFQPSGESENPVGGVVADNSGNYSIKMPTGAYTLVAFKSNFVANFATAPMVTLNADATITTNMPLTNATQNISGKVVDANNTSIGLAGYLLPVQSSDGLLAIAFTDTNGNFTARVVPDQWKISQNDQSLADRGYLALQNNLQVDTTTGSVSGVTIALPKATAIFYGTMKDNLGHPLAGVNIYASDQNQYLFEIDAYTDTNGNYIAGALAESWQIDVDNDQPPNLTDYDFSSGTQTTLSSGQAYHYNFTAVLATNHISGNVQFNGSPVSGVQVYADNGNYETQADTDNNGNYSLNVANGSWYVSVNCQGGNDSLDNILGSGNYQCPNSQNVTIANDSQTVNFTIEPPGVEQIYGYVMDPNGDPVVGVNVYADDGAGDNYSTTTDGTGYYSFNVVNGNWDVSVDCGGLNTLGYQCVNDDYVDVSGNSVEADFTVQFNNPLQITTTSLPNGTNGTFYSQTFQASGGTPPYSWAIADYSVLPSNLILATNGVLSGEFATTVGAYFFDVVVNDSAMDSYTQTLSLTVVSPPLTITNTSLPNGNVGVAYSAQLGATGGQSPYSWGYALGSVTLSSVGLSLNSSGLLSGTPATNKVSTFKVQVTDSSSVTMTNSKVLSITINPKPVLSLPDWLANQFQMQLTGGSNQNYTIQVSTNLSSTNWTTLYVTNSVTTNSFLVVDPNATNKQRFYRAVIGP